MHAPATPEARTARRWASATTTTVQHAAGVVYRARRPTATPLYPVVQHHLETFLAGPEEADPVGFGVSAWVERDFRAYLRCGMISASLRRASGLPSLVFDQHLGRRVLAHGFATTLRAVPPGAWTVARRGWCPSHAAREAGPGWNGWCATARGGPWRWNGSTPWADRRRSSRPRRVSSTGGPHRPSPRTSLHPQRLHGVGPQRVERG